MATFGVYGSYGPVLNTRAPGAGRPRRDRSANKRQRSARRKNR